MDRIELSQSPNRRRLEVPSTTGSGSGSGQRLSAPQLQRAASQQARPSIRIQRTPSYSLSQSGTPINGTENLASIRDGNNRRNRIGRTTSVSASDARDISSRDFAGQRDSTSLLLGRNTNVNNDAPGEEQDDGEIHTGRRRSSSEPRPGRFSAPPSLTFQGPRENSSTPMPALAEEGHQRPNQEFGADLLEPPSDPTNGGGSFRRLRRASNAAVNRLSRGRSSTIGGGSLRGERSPGGFTTGGIRNSKADEYGPKTVDVLDVLGWYPCVRRVDGNTANII